MSILRKQKPRRASATAFPPLIGRLARLLRERNVKV
jgi:hypothetical protein